MSTRKKGRIGSSFDDFLKEENIYDEVEATAIKRAIAWQLENEEPTHEQAANGAADENEPESARPLA